jgi:AcrR family transcriptional regulator
VSVTVATVTSAGVEPNTDESPARDTPGIRERLAEAAFTQFNQRGFDATTVDQIADAAGVSRRTFFRYFKTKEDAIFPEHDRLRAIVAADLRQRDNEPALAALCASITLIMADYARHREVSLLRFALTRTVTSLRDREITAVHRYQRLFVRHLRQHSPTLDAQTIEIMAAAVVAAHNSVLRDWLVNGANGDPIPQLRRTLTQVQALFPTDPKPARAAETVVAVFTVDTPMAEVITAIHNQIDHHDTPGTSTGGTAPATKDRRR